MILSPKVSSFCVVPCCGTRLDFVVKASMNPLTMIRAFGAWLGPTRESRIRRHGKINVKQPPLDLSLGHAAGGWAVDAQEEFISASRRRIPGPKEIGSA